MKRSVVLTFVPLVSGGVAFDVLAGDALGTSLVGTISAYAAAWAIGFLALPFPSGVVVRELVLLALLDIELGDLVAVSLAHRTVNIIAEFSLMLLFSLFSVAARRRPA